MSDARRTSVTPEEGEHGNAGRRQEHDEVAFLRNLGQEAFHQFRSSYWASLIAALVGLVGIVATIVAAVFGHLSSAWVAATIAAITSGVSGLFFVQSNKARIFSFELFKLYLHEKRLSANIAVADQLADGDLRDRLKVFVAYNQVVPDPTKSSQYNDTYKAIISVKEPRQKSDDSAQN